MMEWSRLPLLRPVIEAFRIDRITQAHHTVRRRTLMSCEIESIIVSWYRKSNARVRKRERERDQERHEVILLRCTFWLFPSVVASFSLGSKRTKRTHWMWGVLRLPNLPTEPGRRKMLENELLMLLRFPSCRLNGSYDELGVSCIGVVCDRLDVMDEPPPFSSLPLAADSIAFLRMFTSRNSRSTRNDRAMSTISSDSSVSGSSASICCFSIFSTCKGENAVKS